MLNGVINVYKEQGFTSHDVVAKLRGILHQKKIGHTGTLDPDAVGVLPVCLGKGTKVCDMLTDKDKVYEAILRLGVTTDTQDMTGTVISDMSPKVKSLTEEQVSDAVLGFKGEYDQIPPMYSAIKINGKKLYELARQGKEVERKPRRVNIVDIEILEINLPQLKMRVHCSKGTYIRTLCQDIGNSLGVGGCMEHLVRTKVGMFDIDNAKTLAEIEAMGEKITKIMINVDDMFDYPSVTVLEEYNKLIYNGNIFYPECVKGGFDLNNDQKVKVYDENNLFIGVYEYDGSRHQFKIVKMFMDK